jgi:cephalosporin-C deacetylase-like acetyl esterase
MKKLILTVVVAIPGIGLWAPATSTRAQEADLAGRLRALDGAVAPPKSELARDLRQMVGRDIRARRDQANRRETKAWNTIDNCDSWDRYRRARIQALRDSLGAMPPIPTDLKIRKTGTVAGERFVIENLLFESRPGLWVTANLYRPEKPGTAMPGILICHSHHNPKSQGELQDMGMTWARAGCLVLVMDQLGHGERRQHPFTDSKTYPGQFKPGRQDYYFRYNVGIQLHLIGDSLIGWMVWDLMRGVDLLLARPGIDRNKIILLGAVAGGGEPCAVTAAVDSRIAAAVPFNFGGPQPESRFPLPDNAEDAFNYAGGGSWESTRNLRLSCRDGFLPWVIVGSRAPAGLVYAHEFSWDLPRDPVWKRLQKIYSFYESPHRLAYTAGKGKVTGKPPDSTHCNNIGRVHRPPIHEAFKKWFDLPIPAEYQKRRPAKDLQCLTPDAGITMTPLFELADRLGAERVAAARRRLESLKERPAQLRKDWARLLGLKPADVAPTATVSFEANLGGVKARGILLRTDAKGPGHSMMLPLLLLLPKNSKGKLPTVVALAQEGKQPFLKHRADTIAALLEKGVAVCLPDLRGTGETQPEGDSRRRMSASTGLSSTELMLGGTMLGGRLTDLQTVLAYLRRTASSRIALWGDSFAKENPTSNGATDANLKVPLDADRLPAQSEPLGGLLALFGALFDDDVRSIYVRGGLSGYQSVLQSPFIYFPHDAVVPGALTAGDLCDVAASLAPRPLKLEALVDGLNRAVSAAAIRQLYEPAIHSYQGAGAKSAIHWSAEASAADRLADWFVANLK